MARTIEEERAALPAEAARHAATMAAAGRPVEAVDQPHPLSIIERVERWVRDSGKPAEEHPEHAAYAEAINAEAPDVRKEAEADEVADSFDEPEETDDAA